MDEVVAAVGWTGATVVVFIDHGPQVCPADEVVVGLTGAGVVVVVVVVVVGHGFHSSQAEEDAAVVVVVVEGVSTLR